MRPWVLLAPIALVVAGCASPGPSDALLDPEASLEPAGRAAAPDDPPEPTTAEALEPPQGSELSFETSFTNGSVDALALVKHPFREDGCMLPVVRGSEHTSAAFEGVAGASALLVEMRWTSAGADLDLSLDAPDRTGYGAGVNGVVTPSGHTYSDCGSDEADPRVALLIEDPEALALEGEWRWLVWPKGDIDERFTVAVTVFRGAPPPPGFTALPSP